MLSDLATLGHLLLKPIRGRDQAARLECFYHGQAEAYDGFRRRLLAGREALFRQIAVPDHGVWVDLGGGTGGNLEFLGPDLARLAKAYVVDLSPSMLDVARRRVRQRQWTNVECLEADATTFRPAEGQADVVTFSYSLTMIPDWVAAIDSAQRMLRPGGTIGVVDFFVARKYPAAGMPHHGWATRTFWPTWFGFDNVFLSPDHVPLLHSRFAAREFFADRARVPYLLGLRVPYYRFIGVKPAER